MIMVTIVIVLKSLIELNVKFIFKFPFHKMYVIGKDFD